MWDLTSEAWELAWSAGRWVSRRTHQLTAGVHLGLHLLLWTGIDFGHQVYKRRRKQIKNRKVVKVKEQLQQEQTWYTSLVDKRHEQRFDVNSSVRYSCEQRKAGFQCVPVVPDTCLLMSSLSSSCSSSQPSRSVMSSIFLVVARALSSFSKIHFTWYHSFMSPADSLKGFGTTFPIRTMPFGILSLHFLQPAVPRLAYSTRNLCSAMSGSVEKHWWREGWAGALWTSLCLSNTNEEWWSVTAEKDRHTFRSCWHLTGVLRACRPAQPVLWAKKMICLCIQLGRRESLNLKTGKRHNG